MRYVELPLHTGRAPRWLFSMMVKLARAISFYIIDEYGKQALLQKLSSPLWFQAFALAIGFDWHSSGTTTTSVAALREALNSTNELYVAGGKGKKALSTPEEIIKGAELLGISNAEYLVKASRLISKIDNSLIQDGYSLYHHAFIFSSSSFVVIQQGMKAKERLARRYHWQKPISFFSGEQAIIGFKESKALNLVGKEKKALYKAMLDLAKDGLKKEASFPFRHGILPVDLSKRDYEIFRRIKEYSPSSFEELVMFKGLGKKRIRALALLSSLIYGIPLDWKDPVKYSFAHGGKDGIPYPVDREGYRASIRFLEEAISSSKLEQRIKRRALKRLYLSVFASKSQTTLR